ncbi:MAG: beta strand repeat-containing protein, partial [Dolichospermum sp.]
SLSISPSGGAFTIGGSVAGPLVSLSGADNVTIDGLNSGGNALTINNTNTTATAAAVNISGDALLNTITNCSLFGSSIFRTGGVLTIGNSATSAGNTGTISNNNIGSAAATSGNPTNAIYSNNATASSFNTFTLSGNNIFDNFNKDSVNVGVLLTATGNTGWTVTNNKLYQTATRVYTTAQAHRGISILGGSGYTITGNTIGFANASGTGTTNIIGSATAPAGFPSAYATQAANATTYIALNCAFTAGGSVSSIQNNTIAGFAMFTSSGTTSTTSGAFAAIAVTSGSANIGTTTGNTIGATSGQGSIYLASTSAGATVVGIYATSTNAISIQNNTVGAIDVTGTSASTAASFAGINANTNSGNLTISNNTIGNSTANNIRTGYLLTGTNLSNAATTPTTATGTSSCIGINSLTGTGNVIALNSNTFRGWQISGTATTTGGIVSTGIMTGTTPSINANSNAFGTSGLGWVTYVFANAGTITGLSVTNSIATTHNVQNNDFRGINYLAATAGSQTQNYIVCTGGTAANNTTTISGNTFTNLNVNSTGTITFISMTYTNTAAGASKVCTNNSIVTGFTRASTAASGGITLIIDNGSSNIPSNVSNNNFSNITASGGTASITGISLTDGGSGTIKTVTGNTLTN